jgi:diacylglycerol kinase
MRFLKSVYYAANGIWNALKTERNFKIQLVCAIGVVALGWFFQIAAIEWVAIIVCIGMVLGAELLNSAIEHLSNIVHREEHPVIGKIKDMSAGAVLLLATSSLIVALIIFAPKIKSLL